MVHFFIPHLMTRDPSCNWPISPFLFQIDGGQGLAVDRGHTVEGHKANHTTGGRTAEKGQTRGEGQELGQGQ